MQSESSYPSARSSQSQDVNPLGLEFALSESSPEADQHQRGSPQWGGACGTHVGTYGRRGRGWVGTGNAWERKTHMGNILPNYLVSTRFASMGRGNCGLDLIFAFPFRSVFCLLSVLSLPPRNHLRFFWRALVLAYFLQRARSSRRRKPSKRCTTAVSS